MPEMPFSNGTEYQLFGAGRSNKVKPSMKIEVPPPAPAKARDGFLFGADPEFFLVDDNGKFRSAAGVIPGSKEVPYTVKKGAVQCDGMAAEINIDPAHTFEEFSRNLDTVVSELKKMLPKGWKLSTQPTVVFDEDVFAETPDEAKILGCSPDFNAWEMTVNPPPDIENPRLRCIGGHVHIGWRKDGDPTDLQHILACADLAKQLDWFVAAWALNHDTDELRRTLYGKAGSCRIKEYGVEYRVLSSFWVLDEKLRLEVWNRIQAAITNMNHYYMPDRTGLPKFNKMVIESINTGKLTKGLASYGQFPIETLDERFIRL